MAKPLDEARFHARACLLAVVGKQQDPSSLNGNAKERLEGSDDEDGGEGVSDADGIFPKDSVTRSGKKKLSDTFLDRLAEVVSREKPKPGGKAEHVAATAMVEGDDGATVYVAKNGGRDEIAKDASRKLWQSILLLGCQQVLLT